MIEEASKEFESMKKRLKTLRERAVEAGGDMQGTFFEKLNDLETRIFSGGEAVPLEVLDAEVQLEGEESTVQ